MAKVHRSGTSLRDLDSIYDYVAESSPRNAEMLMRQFHDRFALLAANPEMGRPRPEFLNNIRSWNLHRFIIFYLPQDDGITVIRVLHSAMDIGRRHFR